MDEAARTDWSLCGHLVAPGPARPLLPIVTPVLLDVGFYPVRIRMTGEAGKMTLQIMAEDETGALRIEDCETISHALSAAADVENPISGAYALEVSSPGLARPLTRPVDFERWAGYEAKLEVTQAVDGQGGFAARWTAIRMMRRGLRLCRMAMTVRKYSVSRLPKSVRRGWCLMTPI